MAETGPTFDKEFLALVDPVDGLPLRHDGSALVSTRGKRYPIDDGIVDILDEDLVDSALISELEVFENIPIEKVCYFQPALLEEAIAVVRHFLNGNDPYLSCVDIGGGEGYFATAFKKVFSSGNSYVCDLSKKHLQNAPSHLRRIRCDVRKPYLAPASVDAAAFWVSLHHFSEGDMDGALSQARTALRPGGILVLFEPSMAFAPRRLLLVSSLKRYVYFDEEEKALRYSDLLLLLERFGFKELFVTGHNPPYNFEFVRKLSFGPLFYLATQTFHNLERVFRLGPRNWWVREGASGELYSLPLSLGSYFFSVLKLREDA